MSAGWPKTDYQIPAAQIHKSHNMSVNTDIITVWVRRWLTIVLYPAVDQECCAECVAWVLSAARRRRRRNIVSVWTAIGTASSSAPPGYSSAVYSVQLSILFTHALQSYCMHLPILSMSLNMHQQICSKRPHTDPDTYWHYHGNFLTLTIDWGQRTVGTLVHFLFPKHQTRTSTDGLSHVPKLTNLSCLQRVINIQPVSTTKRIVAVWNNLENGVIKLSSLKCFKNSWLLYDLSKYISF